MDKEKMQRYHYQLTINNPFDYGYTHERIKELLITEFTTLQFFCMADEIGEKGTPHTHIFVAFRSRVRWGKIKKAFPETHIEVAHGTIQSNIEYIQKSGKWESTNKAETKVEGTYEEWGTIPTQKGKLADMEELYEMVKNGYTNSEILAINNDYILHIDKIDKLRTMMLQEKYKDTRRLDLKVTYISGATGKGKTRSILDTYGDSNVYRVTDFDHAFDLYKCEPVLVFEEFRSSLKISDMLNYLDIYPMVLPARYSNRYACYTSVFITTNWELEKQYEEVQKNSPESWKAFLRRIHEVQIFNENGTIDIYHSVDEYLKRNETFKPITKAEQMKLPFEE